MKKAACFFAGLLLAAALLVSAVLFPALSTARFENALINTVNAQALGASESDLSAFAETTMQYLRGQIPEWDVRLPHTGVPDAFRLHMAEVRGWVAAAPWLIGSGLVIGAVLLWLGGFSRKSALAGVLSLIALMLCIALWAAADFRSLWMVLHKALIPGGIFSAREPVMQLFPLALFMRYALPVCLWAAGLLAALCAFLYFLKPKGQIR